jgi:1,4-dihydroxy-2-naphthoate octaprenyltransferase
MDYHRPHLLIASALALIFGASLAFGIRHTSLSAGIALLSFLLIVLWIVAEILSD